MAYENSSLSSGSSRRGISGGVADKHGNRYELAWAVSYALMCIQHEQRTLTLEDVNPILADGSEFTYVDEHGQVSVAQVKRQNGTRNHWTVPALHANGIFDAAKRHVAAGRTFRFASAAPCGVIRSLTERARQSESLDQFEAHLITDELSVTFDKLAGEGVLGSRDTAWVTLRGMWFEVIGEAELVRHNTMVADSLLQGGTGSTLTALLGDILLNNLSRRLSRSDFVEFLSKNGVGLRQESSQKHAREQVRMVTRSWERSVERELLQPRIEDHQAASLLETLLDVRVVLVTGPGGGGKSSVVQKLAVSLRDSGHEVLAFRLDRLDSFRSTEDLGSQLGLSTSPAIALSTAAAERDSVLVIDQLDAVSVVSGRLPERFDVIQDLIEEACAHERMRVVLVCRAFDVENDYRIRKLNSGQEVRRIPIEPLPAPLVISALEKMGADPAAMSIQQIELLRSPLNLVLFDSVNSHGRKVNFTSRDSLYDEFWERKRQRIRASHPTIRFAEVLSRIANAASDAQSLSIPVEILDRDDFRADANVLASEQLLSMESGRVAFFHETFFDYAFARHWLARQQSIRDFLIDSEQELFRRSQVRQVLEMLRERDRSRFRNEVEVLVTAPEIRFHIKDVVASVFAGTEEPTVEDLAVLARIEASHRTLGLRIWGQIPYAPGWFVLLQQEGIIANWLDSGEEHLVRRALNTMRGAQVRHLPEITTLLDKRKSVKDFGDWMRSLLIREGLDTSPAFLKLVLWSIKHGAIDAFAEEIWLLAHHIQDEQPLWVIELLSTCIVQNPSALSIGASGKIQLLARKSPYGLKEVIERVSELQPVEYAEAILPYLLWVMKETSYDREAKELRRDHQFDTYFRSEPGFRGLSEALYESVALALETWAANSPEEAEETLQLLIASEFQSAYALLYRALIAGSAYYAESAAALLLEGESRFDVGCWPDPVWPSRELVAAVAPHVTDLTHARLEEWFRDMRTPFESFGHRYGWLAFVMLSALESNRLSDAGRRRLAEYQRKFGAESPDAPEGVVGFTVESPIKTSSASRMSDEQWLHAMAKYASDDRGWSGSVGGAAELAQVLKSQTVEDPERFARLAVRMTAEVNPLYFRGLLWGLGEAAISREALPSVFAAIRHIASLKLPECDRWIGHSVRGALDETPLDVVALILDRSLEATDPVDNSPVVSAGDDEQRGKALRLNGINTARGNLAEELGDLLVRDSSGERTTLVAPYLVKLASDPVLSVRACVAHTIAACLRHDRVTAYNAFQVLIDCDDVLLASEHVVRLMMYIGNVDADQIDPVIERMLSSSDAEVRLAGGKMAAFAALQWDREHFLHRALASDVDTRVGVAVVCAARVDNDAGSETLAAAIGQLIEDDDDRVREAIADIAMNLRGTDLTRHFHTLRRLIETPTFVHATPQLFITLQSTTARVDRLVVLAADRFGKLHGGAIGDLRTNAAGDVHYIADLAVRGLAQSTDSVTRAALLDVVDKLLELGGYGVHDAVQRSERR